MIAKSLKHFVTIIRKIRRSHREQMYDMPILQDVYLFELSALQNILLHPGSTIKFLPYLLSLTNNNAASLVI